ncbi:copper chaperone PCu(A)C [Hyphomonas sp.]|uniref:copper chaperone PCu(A)C n=1 Tax=Hyphomonas sp. TaxID=87 RepID=UPI001D3E750A|nr:copper chaperone PCu(A)C [Hyphomonas sp.]MBU4060836.1 copper chaperone PCu(A)C [Alphaproteobacteria bacterium]MBU4164820.1 copper chaperone PCu(A)C [Alphaproteobacteria bacterium]
MRIPARLVLPVLVLLGACGAPASAPGGGTQPGIEVRDAFIVQPPEGREVTGGGMQISVTGSPVVFTGASTPVADTVELHTMSMENNMMQMRKVESFPVSEGAPLVLERGGNHLMLFGLEPLQVGEQVDVTLTFTDESGAQQTVVTKAEVVSPAG